MKKIFVALLLVSGITAQAQIQTVSLQASGLTCSMCSKAVLKALEAVPFVAAVKVDIKNQQYNLTFKEGSAVNFDALGKAVQQAGFSVASMQATVNVSHLKLAKDEHIQLGGQTVHVLNATGQSVNGPLLFTLVDKAFVSAKAFKKYASLSKMACVQTGRMAGCCKQDATSDDRIYHVVI